MTINLKKLCCITLMILFLCAGGVCAGEKGEGHSRNGAPIKNLRVGALFPMSGDLALGATEALHGVKVAVELFNEINEHGITVDLFTADAPSPSAAVSAVQQLVERDRVDVIIGTYSSAVASVAVPAAERLGTLYLETTAFAQSITRNSQNVIRTTISSGALGAAAVDFILTVAANRLDIAEDDMRVAVIRTDDEFGTSMANAAMERLGETTAKLVLDESYPAGAMKDFSPVLLRIRQEKPHAVVHVAQVSDAVLFRRQARELDVDIPMVVGTGGGYGRIEFARALGADADGIFNVVPPASGSIDVTSLSAFSHDLLGRLQEKLEVRGWNQGNYTDWAFMGTWVFLNEVAPHAVSTSVEDFMEAAAHVQVDKVDSITGFGFEFAGMGDADPGQNRRAIPVVQQWKRGRLLVVYPEGAAVTRLVNVPLPTWSQRSEKGDVKP